MTAPYAGPTPTQRLFQTIVTLKELRQRDEAAQLAREQFGLQQAQFGLTQQEQARIAGQAQEQGLAALQAIRQNVTDPSALLPHVDAFSRMTGAPADVVTSILQGTPTSAATTRNAAVSTGYPQLGGSLDKEAASAAVTGQDQGANALSGLHQQIFNGAQHFVSLLPPAEQQAFNQRVAEKVGSGMAPADATADELFQRSPRVDQIRAMQIARGLAPSASTDMQASIANRTLALDYSKQAFEEQSRTLQLDIAKSEAQARLAGKDPETAKKVIDLLDLYNKSWDAFQKSSTTLTPTGIVTKAQGINSIVDELQKIAPDQFPAGVAEHLKIPLGKSPSTTSGTLQWLSKFRALP